MFLKATQKSMVKLSTDFTQKKLSPRKFLYKIVVMQPKSA
uniref:Uncharacterized protein n=1 Tax=Rhizophora mucronata TaxID=61149 RepID=A0A2P2P8F9_RHIMU